MGCGGLPSGIIGQYDFSFYEIYTNIWIKEHQQMVVFNEIIIFEGKELRIDGELALL